MRVFVKPFIWLIYSVGMDGDCSMSASRDAVAVPYLMTPHIVILSVYGNGVELQFMLLQVGKPILGLFSNLCEFRWSDHVVCVAHGQKWHYLLHQKHLPCRCPSNGPNSAPESGFCERSIPHTQRPHAQCLLQFLPWPFTSGDHYITFHFPQPPCHHVTM